VGSLSFAADFTEKRHGHCTENSGQHQPTRARAGPDRLFSWKPPR